jgi:uncharacterized membrane protein
VPPIPNPAGGWLTVVQAPPHSREAALARWLLGVAIEAGQSMRTGEVTTGFWIVGSEWCAVV